MVDSPVGPVRIALSASTTSGTEDLPETDAGGGALKIQLGEVPEGVSDLGPITFFILALALLFAAAKRAKRTRAFICTTLGYSVLLTSSTHMTSAVVLDTFSGLSTSALDPSDDSTADSRAADIVAFWSTDSSDDLLLRIDSAELEVPRCREGDSPEHPDCDAVCDAVDAPLSADCVAASTPGVVNTGPQTCPSSCEYNGIT